MSAIKEVERPLTIEELINQGENDSLEFKSTFSYDLELHKRNNRLEFSVLKTIVAFNNSGGGTLLIGVNDDGIPTGLKKDFQLYNDQDRFELHLMNVISTKLGTVYTSGKNKNLKIFFIKIESEIICKIEIYDSKKPIYIIDQDKNGIKKEKYYVRQGNQSVEIKNISEINEHIKENFDMA